MTRGYWDRDGFHEGPMPATDFTPRRAPIADASGQVHNSPQPTTEFGRVAALGAPESPCSGGGRSSVGVEE